MNNEVFDTGLEAKVFTLSRNYNHYDIVIVGDSRAYRQIDPLIIEKMTGFTCINTAVEQCDITTSLNAVKKYLDLHKIKLIILNVTAWEINSSLTDEFNFKHARFVKCSLLDHLLLFDLKSLIERYKAIWALYKRTVYNGGLFRPKNKDYISTELIINKGFIPIETIWQGECDWQNTWFVKYKPNGPATNIIKKTLSEANSLGPKILLILGPYNGHWIDLPKNNAIYRDEEIFEKKINKIVKYKENIFVCNLFANEIRNNDSLFFDALHLNSRGAIQYSTIISDYIIANKLLSVK